MQTAIANGLKPLEYFVWVLVEVPRCDLLNAPENVILSLPWSDAVPENYLLKPGKTKQEKTEEPVLLPPAIDIETIESKLPKKIDEIFYF